MNMLPFSQYDVKKGRILAVCQIRKDYFRIKGIPDPDPTFQVFPDPIPDPGQNPTFLPSQRKKNSKSFRSV